MKLEELKLILDTVSGPVNVHIKYRTDLEPNFNAAYKKSPNHMKLYKITDVDSVIGASYETMMPNRAAAAKKVNKDGTPRKNNYTDVEGFSHDIILEKAGNYYISIYTSNDHAKNNRSLVFEMYDSNDNLVCTFDWDYLRTEIDGKLHIFLPSFWNKTGTLKPANPSGEPMPTAADEYGIIVPKLDNILELKVIGPANLSSMSNSSIVGEGLVDFKQKKWNKIDSDFKRRTLAEYEKHKKEKDKFI